MENEKITMRVKRKSQLSGILNHIMTWDQVQFVIRVGYVGFEPAASPLSGVRSNQLS